MREINGGINQAQDHELPERALFVDGIHHVNVEYRRFVETANGVVEQDVGVFEEPRNKDHGHGKAHQAAFCGDGEEKGEDNQQRRGSAADRTEEVAEDVQVAVNTKRSVAVTLLHAASFQ